MNKRPWDNMNLDFFFNKDDGQFKVVAFWNSGKVIQMQTITEEAINKEFERKAKYSEQEEK